MWFPDTGFRYAGCIPRARLDVCLQQITRRGCATVREYNRLPRKIRSQRPFPNM
ncbi:hypothetical protein C8Q73DRAFT_686879 [Cubamyces lactineus]|nr:hypothetical protein C8Q73DRAFT_686879 [Cubamyces lactineus]